MEHELKCKLEYFQPTIDKRKTLELRIDDRLFTVGDTLLLREWDIDSYTGRQARVRVTHIVASPYMTKGHVAMSVKLLNKEAQPKSSNYHSDRELLVQLELSRIIASAPTGLREAIDEAEIPLDTLTMWCKDALKQRFPGIK